MHICIHVDMCIHKSYNQATDLIYMQVYTRLGYMQYVFGYVYIISSTR